MSIIRNRELSQFGSFLYIDDATQSVAITESGSKNVGIGSTIPTSKLDILGDVKISGIITATSFSGIVTFATATDYASVAGVSTLAIGIGSTASLNTSGIITASAFYINDTLVVNPDLQTWFIGSGSTIYRLNGNIGIGTSLPTEKLSVSGNINAFGNVVAIGNITAGTFISTITSGTSPFSVLSNTLVTNLNADFLRGKTPPGGDIVGTSDSQTLSNKTLTTPFVSSGGATFNGTSGSTVLRAATSASGTLTLPAETGTLVSTGSVGAITSGMILDGTITNSDISASASIAISKLASSTISGVSLGNNLNSLSFGSYLSASASYNGSSAITVSVAGTSLNTANTVVARNSSGDFTVGSINCSNLTASFTVEAADFNSTSDINLKTNVNTIENSLDIVNSLRGVSFDWKETQKSSYGVIAQELEEILPELVATKDHKSVNYNGLVGVLIEAVKELSAKVEELESRLN
jgi:hypothetical protein